MDSPKSWNGQKHWKKKGLLVLTFTKLTITCLHCAAEQQTSCVFGDKQTKTFHSSKCSSANSCTWNNCYIIIPIL